MNAHRPLSTLLATVALALGAAAVPSAASPPGGGHADAPSGHVHAPIRIHAPHPTERADPHLAPPAASRVGPGPYAGLQAREVKAFSAQQLSEVRAGRGMAMALPAELQAYPGPMHVLELADALRLTALQRARTEQLLEEMKAQARSLGEAWIAAERRLDALFATGSATRETVEAAVADAARAQGRVRAAHLRQHVEMKSLLSAEQVAAYGRARGY